MEIIWFFYFSTVTNVYTTQYSDVFMHCGMVRRADWHAHCCTLCESVIRISQSTLSAIFNYLTRCYLATGYVRVQVHIILCMGICSCACICIHMCVEDSFSVIPHCVTWFLRQGLWLRSVRNTPISASPVLVSEAHTVT